MPTIAQLIADTELQVYQGEVSDDQSLDRDQVKFWLTYHLNQLVANELNSKQKLGEEFPAVYIQKETVELLDADEEENSTAKYHIYAEIDGEILTLNNDGGIIKIEDEDGNEIKKAGTRSLSLFKHMRFSKPSSENVLHCHEGNRIYLPGLQFSDIDFQTIDVWYVPQQNLLTAAESTEVLVSDLVLPELINMTVGRAKNELYGSQEDRTNDGVANDIKPVYHQQIRQPE